MDHSLTKGPPLRAFFSGFSNLVWAGAARPTASIGPGLWKLQEQTRLQSQAFGVEWPLWSVA